MTKPAISIKNLTKVYKIYTHPSDMLKEIVFRKNYHQEFKALDNVSFDIYKGEVVGIIGRNGSGKSTLLKIITGTLDKTEGDVKIHGKVSAILDLGLGFNPEYTGRENIYNGAMILGMTRKEISKKVQSIINFSELDEFIDRPFKTYSAGMQARLTFSVATALEPEIMIIDEALAAGDMFFVTKCMDKIIKMCRSGATVLFVSHALPLVQRLCQRAIYLEQGEVIMDGPALNVCQAYERQIMFEINEKLRKENKVEKENNNHQDILQKGPIKISKVQVFDNKNNENYSIYQNEKMTVRIHYLTEKSINDVCTWVLFTRSDGVNATSYLSSETNNAINILGSKGFVDIIWDPILLGEGDFLISCGFYPKKKGKFPSTISSNSYVIHNQRYKFSIKRKRWPLQTVFDQPVKINHFPDIKTKI